MRTVATLLFIAAISMTSAIAQGFLNIPANNTWTKVLSGETTEWSIITSAHPKTRIDLLSFLGKDGTRSSYYMVRSACPNGKAIKYLIEPGKKSGLGIDCDGKASSGTSIPIDEAPKLPPEAAALLKH